MVLGMISKGIKWMFNTSSPFYVKPRLNKDLIEWGLKFMKSCTPEHVQQSLKTILDINLVMFPRSITICYLSGRL